MLWSSKVRLKIQKNKKKSPLRSFFSWHWIEKFLRFSLKALVFQGDTQWNTVMFTLSGTQVGIPNNTLGKVNERHERATKKWQWTRWVEILLAVFWSRCHAAEFQLSTPWWRKKFCFAGVLLFVDLGIVEYSPCEPFLFDIIEFFAESNIPESKRLFTLMCNYFS